MPLQISRLNTHKQRSTEASLIPKCKFRPSKPNEIIPHQCKQRPHLATLKWPNIYMESGMEVVRRRTYGQAEDDHLLPLQAKGQQAKNPGSTQLNRPVWTI
jgi:hypothetical protein